MKQQKNIHHIAIYLQLREKKVKFRFLFLVNENISRFDILFIPRRLTDCLGTNVKMPKLDFSYFQVLNKCRTNENRLKIYLTNSSEAINSILCEEVGFFDPD